MLSFNAGYVDTAGFLALQGLFTAHVTGNFVTFGAAVALGTTGAVAKLLALPVFCVVVIGTRYLAYRLERRRAAAAARNAGAETGAADRRRGVGDPVWSLSQWRRVAGAHHRHGAGVGDGDPERGSPHPHGRRASDHADDGHDDADHDRSRRSPARRGPEAAAATRARLVRMTTSVVAFALGCGAAALTYVLLGGWCFAVPPVIALASILVSDAQPKSDAR